MGLWYIKINLKFYTEIHTCLTFLVAADWHEHGDIDQREVLSLPSLPNVSSTNLPCHLAAR
jgi:hypothetical protein